MPKHNHLWIQVVMVVLLISIISYQAYVNYEIKNQIASVNVDLKAHEKLLTNINTELDNFKTQANLQLGIIDKKLKISSSQITNLKEDLSNIQVQSKDFSSIINDILPTVVSIITDFSQGSGTIISKDGYIVTNYHVIEDARVIRVLTFDNSVYKADVIGVSKEGDIAMIKINEKNLNYLEFGDSDEVRIGEKVIALGNPAGLSFSVTEGIISATNRIGPNGLKAYIQTDVPINPGNSGGPLVNIKKEIMGINNFKIGGFESLGFAIDSNHVKEIVDKIFAELEKQALEE